MTVAHYSTNLASYCHYFIRNIDNFIYTPILLIINQLQNGFCFAGLPCFFLYFCKMFYIFYIYAQTFYDSV